MSPRRFLIAIGKVIKILAWCAVALFFGKEAADSLSRGKLAEAIVNLMVCGVFLTLTWLEIRFDDDFPEDRGSTLTQDSRSPPG